MSNTNVAMLKIDKVSSGSSLTLSLEGRLDSMTASQLEAEVKSGFVGGVRKLPPRQQVGPLPLVKGR